MDNILIIDGFSTVLDIPAPVPAWPSPGWTIYNAPRPLPGHERWMGEFIRGRYYAAIKLDSQTAQEWIKRCEDLGGVPFRQITKSDIERYKKHVTETFNVDVEKFSSVDVAKSFLNAVRCGSWEVEAAQ